MIDEQGGEALLMDVQATQLPGAGHQIHALSDPAQQILAHEIEHADFGVTAEEQLSS